MSKKSYRANHAHNAHAAPPRSAPTPSRSAVITPRSVVAALENALAAVKSLSVARTEAKLSVSRLTGVARELRELVKVMSVYEC